MVTTTGATLRSRLIADVPLQIFAAIGVVTVRRHLQKPLQDGTRAGERASKLLTVVTLVSVVGLFLGFALNVAGFLHV